MKLFGVELYGGTNSEFVQKIDIEISLTKKPIWIATVNPEFIVETWRDKGFLKTLEKTDYNVVDGNGLLWALAADKLTSGLVNKLKKIKSLYTIFLMGEKREYLIPGVELMEELCKIAERKDTPVYFLGGFGDAARKTAEYFLEKYPKLQLAGYSNRDPDEVDERIFKHKRLVLFVAYGMKKQELWIEKHLDKLPAGIVMGVGRSFDYFSGTTRRAPVWLRKMGLEWFFSAMLDFTRAKRQLKNLPWFFWRVMGG